MAWHCQGWRADKGEYHDNRSSHCGRRKGTKILRFFFSLNTLSAIWRIYPSSKWSSQWPYDGYIRHGWMRSCERGRDSATPECFGRGSQGTIFVRSSKLSLFFPELCSFQRVFCFPRFCKIWHQTFEPWGFWFRRCLGALFENCAPSPGHFLANSDYDPDLFLKISILFSKQSRCYLPGSYGGPQAEQSSLVVVRRKLEWELDFRALARSSAEGLPIVVAFSTSRLRWSRWWSKRDKSPTKSACDYPLSSTKPARKLASFEEPVSETRCFHRFAIRCFPVCGCTVARWSGCRSGTAKKAVIRDTSTVDHRAATILTWVHQSGSLDGGNAPFFVTWCNYRCRFCVRKALWRWFYPRSRKRNHFQTLATGVPELKTLLGTQRLKLSPRSSCK